MNNTLTILSYGAGQDSWTILLKLAFDVAFRKTYAPGRLLVICSDTGNEHPETYDHIAYTKTFCEDHAIEFVHLTADLGFHRGDWVSLQSFFTAKTAIGSVAYPKTCTDNLKVQPIYRFVNDWIQKTYFPGRVDLQDRKRAMYTFNNFHGKIRVLIGIAKGEEKRMGGADINKWASENTEKIYPLVSEGLDRAACQTYIKSLGQPVPPPSNCVMCPFKSPIEILWTAKAMPEQFATWVEFEAKKIAANVSKCKKSGKKNLGVRGVKLLPQVLAEAEVTYAHMSMADLEEYRMSHGHCVASKY